MEVVSYAHFLPENLNIKGTVEPKILNRGMYDVVVYESKLNLDGEFKALDWNKLNINPADVNLDQAFLSVSIPDMRGIKDSLAFNWNNEQKTFEPGKEIDAAVRPYIRLTRIDEVAQTVRPDVVNLSDFQNRKDLVLAVATLQEEFRPTQQARDKVEAYRRSNPGAALPPELARVEALSFSLGTGKFWLG